MSFECGQQRVMRPGWERPRPLASWRVLTNRMREYFTYGSVGGAGGNPGPYPAPNSRPRSPFPASPETQTPDSLRAPSSGGCG